MASAGWAADVGVVGKKLVIVDKLAAANKAKLVYVSTDRQAGITKGAGTDPNGIDVTFRFGYDAAAGRIVVPAGGLDPGDTEGWKTNEPSVAKFVNTQAPAGSTVATVAVVKPDKLLKLVAKGLGDPLVPPGAIDILAAGPPSGDVHTAFLVDNGAEENAHCSTFSGCSYKLIAAGSGAKLTCRSSTADPSCSALVPATTTTSSTTTTSTFVAGICGNGVVDQPSEQCDVPDPGICDDVTPPFAVACGAPASAHECECCAVDACAFFQGDLLAPCCTGACQDTTGVGQGRAGVCLPPACTGDAECNGYQCVGGSCCGQAGDFCGVAGCCPGSGATCSGVAWAGAPVCCLPAGESCTEFFECCSGSCTGGLCD
jgi:hypothetical protein